MEVAIVTYLQKNQKAIYLEIEDDLYPRFTGLLTPSKGLIYAVLNSYAEKESGYWKLRAEDVASARREELNNIYTLIETIGKRLEYKTRKQDKLLHWEEQRKSLCGRSMCWLLRCSGAHCRMLLRTPLSSSLADAPHSPHTNRSATHRLRRRLKKHTLVKYRLLRTLLEVPILTRETFEEQIASDPVEKSTGQMMMF